MIYKYLPVFLLLAANCAYAKSNISLSDSSEAATVAIIENRPHLVMPETIAGSVPPPRYGSSRGSGVYFSYGIELGFSSATLATALTNSAGASIGTSKLKGGGFMYGGELGVKIALPTRNQNRLGILSVYVYGAQLVYNFKYNDGLGNSRTDKRELAVVGLPLSYTSMGYGRSGEGTGFYWELGINLDYVTKVKDNDVVVTSHYNSFYVEPSASVGLSIPFRIIKRGSHQDIGEGRVLLGPFFNYAPTNIAKNSGVTMNGYVIGMRWSYLFM